MAPSVNIRGISSDELVEFNQVLAIPFGEDLSPNAAENLANRFEIDRLRAAVDGDQIVGTFGTLSMNLTVPGGSVPTGGTTLVTVLPTHRRQGILRELMTQHFAELHEHGELLAALWASESAIYGRFGYGIATECAEAKLSSVYARMQRPTDIRGTMRLIDQSHALEQFPAIYEAATSHHPGTFARSEGWWTHRTLADPEHRRRGATSHRYVLHVRSDQAVGYVIYRTKYVENNDLEVRIVELIGVDSDAEKALWEFVFGIDLMSSIVAWNLPVDSPLPWWLEHHRELERKITDAMWVRPIDVAAALSARQYSHPGKLCFRMNDEMCSWNNGVYVLDVDATGHGECRASQAEPEIELTPFTLGCVYLGGKRFSDLARSGLLNAESSILRSADFMFAWDRQPWCPEIF